MRDALRMPNGIGDRNRATLRNAEKSEALDAGGIDNRFEIIDEHLQM